MVFNSLAFFIFAVLFYTLWPRLKGQRTSRYLFICIASTVFYGWWNWRYLPLIYLSALIDFFLALLMVKYPQYKKWTLGVSITISLLILASFKYLHFFYDNLSFLLDIFGIHMAYELPAITLPIGLSFYTFQSISYTIDVYRGYKPTNNFLLFFSYISLFPQLVAGPIERAPRLLNQLEKDPPLVSAQDAWDGFVLIVKGFFRKVFIADNLAVGVNLAYGSSDSYQNPLFWWVVGLMFAFQIYTDFGGYSDIARGLARWMGYRLMENFRHPYSSTTAREFWTRNHVSLTLWFRDYIYLPLRGGSKNPTYAAFCMWVVMLVSGLWHGPSWNFIIWGACLAMIYQLELSFRWTYFLNRSPWTMPLSPIVFLWLSAITNVFFRGESFQQSISVLKKMFTPSMGLQWAEVSYLKPAALFALGMVLLWEILNFIDEKYKIPLIPRSGWAQAVAVGFMVLLSLLFHGPTQSFIYFQF
jgi:alginate O-acetyltransferase complex protein AlgI